MVKELIHLDLPDKPSDLLQLALDDLELCEKDRNYTIDMSEWHTPSQDESEKCAVCIAGAVIAKTGQRPVPWGNTFPEALEAGMRTGRLFVFENTIELAHAIANGQML
jgi:hypothetical protein